MKAENCEYVIEKGTTKDVDELEILYDALNDHFSRAVNYPGWIKGIYPVRETAEDAINEGSLFVLRIDRLIAGSVVLNHTPEAAYEGANWSVEAGDREVVVIRTLVTHPRFMRQGVAWRLMAFAEEYAVSLSAKTIRLDVSVDNLPAIELYERSGYGYVGTVDLGLPYGHLKWFRLYEMIL